MPHFGKTILKNSANQLVRYCIVLIGLLALPFISAGQSTLDSTATLAKIKDTTLKSDTSISTVKNDSTAATSGNLEDRLGIRISKDALDDVVVATATDSAVMDIKSNNFQLYGDAKVDYDGRKLSAPKIEFNQNTNIAKATMVQDTSKKKPNPPTFEQGAEKVSYDSLQYNFKSQRAIIHNARSQYGEGFVISEQIKRNPDKSLYGYKNIYTTCALEHPHFGIRTNKIKIIPEQAIATGSANIEIEGVPTPLFLPFGYFPVNNDKHRSGFILPSYVTEINRGLGFLRGGYYLYLNDYVDLQLQTDIFTKGSFAGYLNSNYVNRYHYNGKVSLSYAVNKTGEEYDPTATIQKDFAFQWQHNKDDKSLPNLNFNADVNVQSGTFFANNSFNTTQILNNQFQSNITLTKRWEGRPYSLTLAARHSQNTTNKQVTVTLPEVNFFINARTPFARKNPIGSARWYEKITVGYTANSLNRITFYDSSFELNKVQLSDFQNGMRHSVPISANYSILRFVTLTFNVAYNEYWNTLKTQRGFNDSTNRIDTVSEYGFAASRDFNGGFSLNTQIYGMKLFKKGAIKGFRHTLRPSVGLNYRPDFAKDPFNYYYQARLDSSQRLTYLSPYEQSIIGLPPQGRNGSMSFGLNNNLQMKVRNGKDTLTGFKNVVLLDALDFNTNYNLAADSFNWDFFRFSARTNIANLLNINASANFDPYQYDYVAMRRTPRTTQASGNGLARLSNAQIGFGTSFRSKEKKPSKNSEAAKDNEDFRSLMRNNGYYNYVDFNIPWTVNLTYAFNLERRPSAFSKSDSSVVTQTINLNGDINFTSRWKVAVATGYNIVEKQITFSSIDIYRDLHCWEMRLGMIPFGFRKSFNFSLNVKAQVLQDLKLTRRRDFRDAAF